MYISPPSRHQTFYTKTSLWPLAGIHQRSVKSRWFLRWELWLIISLRNYNCQICVLAEKRKKTSLVMHWKALQRALRPNRHLLLSFSFIFALSLRLRLRLCMGISHLLIIYRFVYTILYCSSPFRLYITHSFRLVMQN